MEHKDTIVVLVELSGIAAGLLMLWTAGNEKFAVFTGSGLALICALALIVG